MRRFLFAIAGIAFLHAAEQPPDRAALRKRAWDVLDEGLQNKNSAKRARALHGLGLAGNETTARDKAFAALSDEKPEVRAAAARSLGAMEASSAVPKLREALDDSEPEVVLAAADSLYKLKDRASAYEIYYEVLTGERKSGPGAVQSQLRTLRDPKALAKIGFEAGIGMVPFAGIGYEAYQRLTKDDSAPVREHAAQILAEDPDPKSAHALADAAVDGKWRVRAAVLEAIAKRRDRSLVPTVAAQLDDKNDSVRYDAAGALLALTTTPARRSKSAK
jgi:HEAT repeats